MYHTHNISLKSTLIEDVLDKIALEVRISSSATSEAYPPEKVTLKMLRQACQALPVDGYLNLFNYLTGPETNKVLVFKCHQTEINPHQLLIVLDPLVDFLKTVSGILFLEGEAVPVLKSLAENKDHAAQTLAISLLTEIEATTRYLQPQLSHYLCSRCLTRFQGHVVHLGRNKSITCYGCRVCCQNKEYYQKEQVIAVLDQNMTTEVQKTTSTLRVNWLEHHHLFDFDQVEISQVTDHQVEQFVVQIGNDTDSVRQAKYSQIPCFIDPNQNLSENSLRILAQHLGPIHQN